MPEHGKLQPNLYVVEDARYRSHEGPRGHPERPERLEAVRDALATFDAGIEIHAPRLAEPDEILRVHDREHLARVAASAAHAAREGIGRFDADTYFCAESYDVARLAAGGTVDLVRAVMRGEADSGLAAVRPPGHHAEADRAMGFCLFNNVAIAARVAQAEGAEKVAIVDWDVHHGNGTQHTFEEDPSVLYVSTHQFPFYPGTGDAREAGRGRGVGTTFNVPMPAGCGDEEYVGVLLRLVAPALRHFSPDLILVSAGFDAHRDDPLASMEVSRAGFAAMTSIVRDVAAEVCGGRLAFVLEGGYALSGLIDGTAAVLGEVLSPRIDSNALARPDLPPGSLLRGIVDRVAAVHTTVPDLGSGG